MFCAMMCACLAVISGLKVSARLNSLIRLATQLLKASFERTTTKMGVIISIKHCGILFPPNARQAANSGLKVFTCFYTMRFVYFNVYI